MRAAVSPKHATFLAYKQLPTYVAAVEAILQFEVELGRSTFAHGPQGSRVTHDPFAMEIDRITKNIKDIRFTGKKKPRDKSNDICRECNRKGHWASECYTKTRLQPHASTSSGQTGYQVNTFKRTYKGKGRGNKNYKGKGKKKWIRSANLEEQEEEEEEDSSDEEQEMNTNI